MFLDESGINALITRNGNTTQGSFNPYGMNWSHYFDGNGDSLSIDNANLGITSASTPFTVEGWVYMHAVGGCLFANEINTYVNVCVGFSATTSGFNDTNANQTGGRYVTFGYWNNSTWTQVVSSTQVSLHTWTHIACVFTGSAAKIYINGTDVTTGTISSWFTSQGRSNYFIGRRWDAASGAVVYFTGYMSNFRFVKGTAVYTGNFTTSTTPLQPVANTAILTSHVSSTIDGSPRANTIVTTGDVYVSRFSP